jgi:hypothetical protein
MDRTSYRTATVRESVTRRVFQQRPEAQSRQLEVEAGYKLMPATVGIESADYVISVDSVGSDQIIVTYSGVVMENGDGTINLTAPRQGRCLIKIRHRLRLATATMDAGTSISLTLEAIVE